MNPKQFSFFLLTTLTLACADADVLFPENIGLIDVTDFGAIPDDGKDDTDAINQAIVSSYKKQETIKHVLENGMVWEAQSVDKDGLRTVYFPNGIYNISDTLEWRDENGDFRAFLVMQGQSEEGVTLKLADNTFTDPDNPKSMVFTAAGTEDGQGNVAFSNYIQDMTLNTGTGNTGAIGIDYIGSNVCAIRRVTIQSGDGAGVAGIYFGRKWPGPLMLRDITIGGFDYGLHYGEQTNYCTTIEGLTLRAQRKAGIRNNCNAISARNIKSDNRVPVIYGRNENGRSLICILDSAFRGGDLDQPAIDTTGGMYLRNIAISGYRAQPILNQSKGVAEGSRYIKEYVSHAPITLHSALATALHLPIEEIPITPPYIPSQWVVADAPEQNSSAGIQAAIDKANAEGKTTVCLPAGKYYLNDTIVLNGSFERFYGFGAQLIWNPEDPANTTAFLVENRNAPHLFFEHVSWNVMPGVKFFTWVRDNSESPFVFRDVMQWGECSPYVNTKPKKVFIENCAISYFTLTNAQTWAWQFDTEMDHGIKVINDGGDFWILGIKTEWPNTVLRNINGGRVEILGGLIYPPFGSNDPDKGFAAIENIDSDLSATWTFSGNQNAVFVKDTQDGQTMEYTFEDSKNAGHPRYGNMTSLFSSHSHGESD